MFHCLEPSEKKQPKQLASTVTKLEITSVFLNPIIFHCSKPPENKSKQIKNHKGPKSRFPNSMIFHSSKPSEKKQPKQLASTVTKLEMKRTSFVVLFSCKMNSDYKMEKHVEENTYIHTDRVVACSVLIMLTPL